MTDPDICYDTLIDRFLSLEEPRAQNQQWADEASELKLNLLQNTLEACLPIYLLPNHPNCTLFDFFCGSGKMPKEDGTEADGSALRIMEIALSCLEHRQANSKSRITLFFNDADTAKIEKLKENLKPYGSKIRKFEASGLLTIKYSSEKFSECYRKALFTDTPTSEQVFVWCDPFGVTGQIDRNHILDICKRKGSDVVLFFPANVLHRFIRTFPNFRTAFPDYNENIPHPQCHKELCRVINIFLKEHHCESSFVPFSLLKKNQTNIYGLLLGSRNKLGLQKMVKACWMNSDNGESNYTVDPQGHVHYNENAGSDTDLPLFALANEKIELTKVDIFKRDFKNWLRNRGTASAHDIFTFATDQGFTCNHAKESLRELMTDGCIEATNFKPSKNARPENRIDDRYWAKPDEELPYFIWKSSDS